MTDKEQTEHFAKEVRSLIDRMRVEYDLTYANAIGVLMLTVHTMLEEAKAIEDEDSNDHP